jgi:hypothetical protein
MRRTRTAVRYRSFSWSPRAGCVHRSLWRSTWAAEGCHHRTGTGHATREVERAGRAGGTGRRPANPRHAPRLAGVGLVSCNDAMLAVLPIGVMVFPGTGIQANLADKAKKLGIPVWKFGEGGA